MDYQVLASELTDTLGAWDELLPGREKIHLIACGGTEADIEDSLELLRREKVDLKKLEKRYRQTAQYETGENRVLKNFDLLLARAKKGERAP